jgi:hypothetical protein
MVVNDEPIDNPTQDKHVRYTEGRFVSITLIVYAVLAGITAGLVILDFLFAMAVG